MTEEQWRPVPVPGFERNYDVSNLGRVRSRVYGAFRIRKLGTNGVYPNVCLKCKGLVKHAYVHRLVLEAFESSPPAGMVAAHLDGNPLNNNLNNLAWTTQAENLSHKHLHGTAAIGEKNPRAKVSEREAALVKHLWSHGYTQSKIAAFVGLSQTQVGRIVRGKQWRHLHDDRSQPNPA